MADLPVSKNGKAQRSQSIVLGSVLSLNRAVLEWAEEVQTSKMCLRNLTVQRNSRKFQSFVFSKSEMLLSPCILIHHIITTVISCWFFFSERSWGCSPHPTKSFSALVNFPSCSGAPWGSVPLTKFWSAPALKVNVSSKFIWIFICQLLNVYQSSFRYFVARFMVSQCFSVREKPQFQMNAVLGSSLSGRYFLLGLRMCRKLRSDHHCVRKLKNVMFLTVLLPECSLVISACAMFYRGSCVSPRPRPEKVLWKVVSRSTRKRRVHTDLLVLIRQALLLKCRCERFRVFSDGLCHAGGRFL